jgi:hypothetical protein
MMLRFKTAAACVLALGLSTLAACGDDDDDRGNEADRIGVAASCSANDPCNEGQVCLTNFKGGYCGLKDCKGDKDCQVGVDCCPNGSRCVKHTDGVNYCFRECVDKVDCNRNRLADAEANCNGAGTVEYVNTDYKGKACVPPSG